MSDLIKNIDDFIKSDKSKKVVIINNGVKKFGFQLTSSIDIDFTRNDLIEKSDLSVNDDYQMALFR